MSDPTARLRAVLALPQEPSSAEALLAAVEDVSLDVARAALRRLEPLAGPAEVESLRGLLLAVDVALVGDVAAVLRELGDGDAVRVAAAGLEASSPSQRQKAAIALRELRDPATRRSLVRALEDDAAPVRRIAIEGLGLLPPEPGSVAACRQALSDSDAAVRTAAVRVLAVLDPAAPATLRQLVADPAELVRRALATAVCALDAETVGLLLGDRDVAVRTAAVAALVACPDMVPLSRLFARSSDESWHVRRAACDALAAAGGEGAGRELIRMLLDERLEVRGRALVALERLYGDTLEDALEQALSGAHAELRRSLIELLGRRGRADVALRYVGDPATEVRIAVVHALAPASSPTAVAALRLLEGDDDAAVRNAAAVVGASPTPAERRT